MPRKPKVAAVIKPVPKKRKSGKARKPYRYGKTPSTVLPPILPIQYIPPPILAEGGLTHRQKLDAVGIDEIERMVLQGVSVRTMAETIGVTLDAVVDWTSDVQRSARIWQARQKCATMWEEKAVEVLQEASGPTGSYANVAVARARELAHHYRWRAGNLRRDLYGPTQPVTNNTMNVVVSGETEAARKRLVADLDELAVPAPLTIEGRAEPVEQPERPAEAGALTRRVKAPDKWE